MKQLKLGLVLASALALSACAVPAPETSDPALGPPTASTLGDSVNSANSLVLPLALIAVIVLAI